MNFLAHLYLSGDDNDIKIGNFIADGIHGKPDAYTPGVQRGIMLHRAIDTFTDAHPIFRQGTKRLHANYHHYAGVIMDIFYDHFLAKNWHEYHKTPLAKYVDGFYELLNERFDTLPERCQGMIPHMTTHNWLVSYASLEGIARTLSQMDHRTKKISGMTSAINELQEFYAEFEQEFRAFFVEMQAHVKQKLTEL
ncbi:ACP phosphodiesterase [Flavobacterium akiainvivens]|uniref:ACP phosphodiesterase n=1 Tax=Flavobacterium akiainvivens TaxID=1202724 RepID=A0A0M9VHT8_9FLAO|nr:acyl carrier protein phosphodiesterase [Flavobacterium akiainvivens]KOS05936.1 ACP phosphodiesterase [Flavobacterium akiainvivens]SFQ53416.1 Acyl carrier protein phosphodiesterase [Flavobacterium akiainvivens]